MIVHDANAYTIGRIRIGITEGRSRLRMAKVEGGYRLGGQTGAKGRDLILFSAVLSRADALAQANQMGHRAVERRQ